MEEALTRLQGAAADAPPYDGTVLRGMVERLVENGIGLWMAMEDEMRLLFSDPGGEGGPRVL